MWGLKALLLVSDLEQTECKVFLYLVHLNKTVNALLGMALRHNDATVSSIPIACHCCTEGS